MSAQQDLIVYVKFSLALSSRARYEGHLIWYTICRYTLAGLAMEGIICGHIICGHINSSQLVQMSELVIKPCGVLPIPLG